MHRQRRRPSSSCSKTLFCRFLSDTLLHLCFVSAEDFTFCESYGIVACTHTLCVVHSAAKSSKIQPFQLCNYHVRSCRTWHMRYTVFSCQISVDPMLSSKNWTSDASVYHTNHPGNFGRSSDQILQQCTTQLYHILSHTITIFIVSYPQDFCGAQTMCHNSSNGWKIGRHGSHLSGRVSPHFESVGRGVEATLKRRKSTLGDHFPAPWWIL